MALIGQVVLEKMFEKKWSNTCNIEDPDQTDLIGTV